jgi:hypothetical protein
MFIRQAAGQDWPQIYPIYAAIMAEGKSPAFPERQSLEEARPCAVPGMSRHIHLGINV